VDCDLSSIIDCSIDNDDEVDNIQMQKSNDNIEVQKLQKSQKSLDNIQMNYSQNYSQFNMTFHGIKLDTI
jgi:hypothetical protein